MCKRNRRLLADFVERRAKCGLCKCAKRVLREFCATESPLKTVLYCLEQILRETAQKWSHNRKLTKVSGLDSGRRYAIGLEVK